VVDTTPEELTIMEWGAGEAVTREVGTVDRELLCTQENVEG
jgi:hypothetical protein